MIEKRTETLTAKNAEKAIIKFEEKYGKYGWKLTGLQCIRQVPPRWQFQIDMEREENK